MSLTSLLNIKVVLIMVQVTNWLQFLYYARSLTASLERNSIRRWSHRCNPCLAGTKWSKIGKKGYLCQQFVSVSSKFVKLANLKKKKNNSLRNLKNIISNNNLKNLPKNVICQTCQTQKVIQHNNLQHKF